MTASIVPSGLGATLTTGVESTSAYGTAVTPDRGFDFNSESIKWDKMTKQGHALRNGRLVARAARRKTVGGQGGGDIVLPLLSKGQGRWYKQALGVGAIAQVGATTAWKQTFTLGALMNLSQTIQIGKPDTSNTMRVFNWLGCRVTALELGADNRDLGELKVSIDAKDLDTAATYTAPDYTLVDAAEVFSFEESALWQNTTQTGNAIGGNYKFGLKLGSAQATDRFHTGGAGRKSQPLINGLTQAQITGDQEFIDLATWVAHHQADDTFAMSLRFRGPLITGSSFYQLLVTVPAVKLNSETPTIGGPDVVKHALDIEIMDDDVNEPITIELTSTDTAI